MQQYLILLLPLLLGLCAAEQADLRVLGVNQLQTSEAIHEAALRFLQPPNGGDSNPPLHDDDPEPPANTWAVLVSGSRYWFNYRHTASTLSLYRRILTLGIPDSRIILMLADDHACNPRNPFAGQVFDRPESHRRHEDHGDGGGDGSSTLTTTFHRRSSMEHPGNLYSGGGPELDFRGSGCSVENLLRLLSGRQPPDTPAGRRLDTDAGTRLLVYMTGHGGDGFLKFHDQQELSAEDLGRALLQMWLQRRFARALVLVDTCQAGTLNEALSSPGTVSAASSARGQNSFSRENDPQLGVSLVDRFTFAVGRWLDRHAPGLQPPPGLSSPNGGLAEVFRMIQGQPPSATAAASKKGGRQASLARLLGSLSPQELRSSVVVRAELSLEPLGQIDALQFFASTSVGAELASEYPLGDAVVL